MNDIILMNIGDWLLVISFLATLALVLIYAKLTRWEESYVGRQFMYTKIMLTIILGLGSISVIFGATWSARPVVRIIVYAALTFMMIRWITTIIKVQNETKGQVSNEEMR